MNNHQLIQTICYGAPHGLQVQYAGEIWTIDPKAVKMSEFAKEEKIMTIPFAIGVVSRYAGKLLLHSTSKLTDPILEGGKVPIVELFKIAFPDNERYHLTEKGTILKKHLLGHLEFLYHFEKSSFISRHYNKEWHVIGYFNIPNQLELFNFMIAKGFNLFNLSEEYVVEKSTVKF